MSDLVLAIDIGGTKMAAAVVDDTGRIHAEGETPTLARGTGEALFQALIQLCDRVLERAAVDLSSIAGVGTGCGGPMKYPEGLVSPLNIRAWRDFPLRARLEAWSGRPVVVDNDAKAYALGEYWVGGGAEATALLGIVVSTGVGGGIVMNGRLVHGAHGNAGHVGHIVVMPNGPRCACGARGCVEAIASGPSMVRRARRARGRLSSAATQVSTAVDLERCARAGDKLALRLFRDAGVALGRGIAGSANLLDLDRVIIGGGVSRASDLFWPALLEELEASARTDFTRGLDVRLSKLRVSASLAGAAALIFLR